MAGVYANVSQATLKERLLNCCPLCMWKCVLIQLVLRSHKLVLSENFEKFVKHLGKFGLPGTLQGIHTACFILISSSSGRLGTGSALLPPTCEKQQQIWSSQTEMLFVFICI